ncbi:Hypothetical_protein [Hexamita inflata]|uniref:Hypothetical_protein n=1 Tax=Hexamita inflata TaxID=28002 RepID=A0AA86Q7B5_9EUKA|nr:Hypothetical protein HINF_LOCUS34959 [Hexamita inflata]
MLLVVVSVETARDSLIRLESGFAVERRESILRFIWLFSWLFRKPLNTTQLLIQVDESQKYQNQFHSELSLQTQQPQEPVLGTFLKQREDELNDDKHQTASCQ